MIVPGNEISLSQQLSQSISQNVRKGMYRSGDFLPSIRTLATEYNVSQNVCFRAIKQLKKEGIVVSIHGKGVMVCETKPAERAAILFGFIQPFPPSLDFAVRVLQNAEHVFTEKGNFVVMQSSNTRAEQERHIAQHLVNNGIQGILLWPVDDNPNGSFFEELSNQVPIVQVDRLINNCDLPAVVYDNYSCGKDIIRKVFEFQGCSKMFALIDDLNISPYTELIRGMQEEASQKGVADCLDIERMGLSGLVELISNCHFSQADLIINQIERLLKEGEYDMFFCSQENVFNYMVGEMGLLNRLPHLKFSSISAGDKALGRTKKYNKVKVLRWINDPAKMVIEATEMLQEAVYDRKIKKKVHRLKIPCSME